MAMAHGDSLDGPHTQRLPEDLNVFCPECDYNMTGAVSSRCPWCGWEINPDELLAGVTSAWSFGRMGFVAAGAIGGVGWSVMATVLVRRGTTLTALDLATVLSMVLASIGCLTLSGLTVLARRSWPLRRGEACNLIGLLGLISIVVGVVGATSALRFETAPRVVRGIAVNGVMEFMLASAFFTLPGWTLLLMRLIGFGSTPTRGGDEPVRNFTGTSTGRGEASFTVEFFRRYDRDQVTQEWTAGFRKTTPAIDRAIALTWEAELAVAESAGRVCFDGALGRLVSADAAAGRLHLVLGETCFREFLGTHLFNRRTLAPFGPEFLATPLGTSVTVRTNDGMLVLGRRSARVMCHAGHLHTIGGILESADRMKPAGFDVFGSAARELAEELNISAAETVELVAVAMVQDGLLRQPELLFEATVALSSAEIASRFAPEVSDGEHVAIEIVADHPDEIVAFLIRAAPVTPVAQAALLLRGRGQWGRPWYDDACRALYGDVPGEAL